MTSLLLRFLGVLLLAAAGLKVYGFGVDPVARMGLLSSSAFQFLVIAFELALGFWLLSGQYPIGAWLIVLVTFAGFACVSFYQGWIGQASCGCLGNKVTVSPWIMFAVDLLAIVALLLARPDLSPLREMSRSDWIAPIVPTVSVLLGYVTLFVSLALFANLHYGSLDAAIASLRQERLSVSPGLLDMGQGVADETREATVELTNWTDRPIRLIGGTSDCSCTVLGDLPVTIPPGESRSISIHMRLPKSLGMFNRKAQLTIDDEGFKTIGFRLVGRIVKAPD
ncbi:MAG: DUF1573 domain-containing protein [Planctomycetes bacterium]|nr:DUF1573 domain-containing protein [Planctomycetota bacterium]